MARRPAPVRHRADVHRHAQAVAGVERHAADTDRVPARPEVARTHLGVRLEPAARKHDRFRIEDGESFRRQRTHARYPSLPILDELDRRGLVMEGHAVALEDLEIALLEPEPPPFIVSTLSWS